MFNYTSGIQANPLMSSGQYDQAMGHFAGPAPTMPNAQSPSIQTNPAQAASLYSQLTGLTHANNQRGQLNFARQYAPMNDQFLMGAEQARANSGLQGGNYMLGREQANYGHAQDARNFLFNSLMPQMGMGQGLGGLFG